MGTHVAARGGAQGSAQVARVHGGHDLVNGGRPGAQGSQYLVFTADAVSYLLLDALLTPDDGIAVSGAHHHRSGSGHSPQGRQILLEVANAGRRIPQQVVTAEQDAVGPQEVADVVVLMAGGEQRAQGHAAPGGYGLVGAESIDRHPAQGVLQARGKLGMAANRAVECFLQPVEAPGVVAVPVGDQDGVNARAAQFVPVVHDLAGPEPVGLTRVDHDHAFRRITHEIDLGAAGVHRPERVGVFLDVGAVNVVGDLHDGDLTNPGSECNGARRWRRWPRHRPRRPAARPTAGGCHRRQTVRVGAFPWKDPPGCGRHCPA